MFPKSKVFPLCVADLMCVWVCVSVYVCVSVCETEPKKGSDNGIYYVYIWGSLVLSQG